MGAAVGALGRVLAGVVVLVVAWSVTAAPVGTPAADRLPVTGPSDDPPGTSGPAPSLPAPVTPVPSDVPSTMTCRPDQPDATEALQRWLDALPRAGARAALGPGRCYRVEGTIALHGLRDFELDGRGATLRAFTVGPADPVALRTRAHVSISGSSAAVVRRLSVDGGARGFGEGVPGEPAPAQSEAQHAFRVDGAELAGDRRTGPNRDIRLIEVAANRVRGDFVYVRATDGLDVERARFGRGSPDGIDGAGRHGVAIVSGTDVTVERSSIWNAARATLDIEPNFAHEVIRDVRLVDSIAGRTPTGPAGLTFIANAGRDAEVDGVVITGNRLRGIPLWIVSSPPRPDTPYAAAAPGDVVPRARDAGFRRRQYVVRDNESDTPVLRSGSLVPNRGVAMYFAGIDGLVVADNVVPLGDPAFPGVGMALVRVRDASDVRVTGNRVPAADGDGATDLVGEFQGIDGLCVDDNEVGGAPAPAFPTDRPAWWLDDVSTVTC